MLSGCGCGYGYIELDIESGLDTYYYQRANLHIDNHISQIINQG